MPTRSLKPRFPRFHAVPTNDRLLHLIAFVAYQTFRLNDTLIDTLLSAVQAAVNSVEKAQKEDIFPGARAA